ncbi:hypothetical protein F5148DRAFT_388331 [Russula earlei]|uniref:Uncharacterized protein n=1 Tax=Russula earlei TaxID=71964 RepID=A0ACC0U030_9AGAM|nr:hypothetical protein F5148DRAFT_388331 [Russula earlei]
MHFPSPLFFFLCQCSLKFFAHCKDTAKQVIQFRMRLHSPLFSAQVSPACPSMWADAYLARYSDIHPGTRHKSEAPLDGFECSASPDTVSLDP